MKYDVFINKGISGDISKEVEDKKINKKIEDDLSRDFILLESSVINSLTSSILFFASVFTLVFLAGAMLLTTPVVLPKKPRIEEAAEKGKKIVDKIKDMYDKLKKKASDIRDNIFNKIRENFFKKISDIREVLKMWSDEFFGPELKNSISKIIEDIKVEIDFVRRKLTFEIPELIKKTFKDELGFFTKDIVELMKIEISGLREMIKTEILNPLMESRLAKDMMRISENIRMKAKSFSNDVVMPKLRKLGFNIKHIPTKIDKGFKSAADVLQSPAMRVFGYAMVATEFVEEVGSGEKTPTKKAVGVAAGLGGAEAGGILGAFLGGIGATIAGISLQSGVGEFLIVLSAVIGSGIGYISGDALMEMLYEKTGIKYTFFDPIMRDAMNILYENSGFITGKDGQTSLFSSVKDQFFNIFIPNTDKPIKDIVTDFFKNNYNIAKSLFNIGRVFAAATVEMSKDAFETLVAKPITTGKFEVFSTDKKTLALNKYSTISLTFPALLFLNIKDNEKQIFTSQDEQVGRDFYNSMNEDKGNVDILLFSKVEYNNSSVQKSIDSYKSYLSDNRNITGGL